MEGTAMAQRNKVDAGFIPLCGGLSLAGIYFEHLFSPSLSFQGIGTPEMEHCPPSLGVDHNDMLSGLFRFSGTAVSPRPPTGHFHVTSLRKTRSVMGRK